MRIFKKILSVASSRFQVCFHALDLGALVPVAAQTAFDILTLLLQLMQETGEAVWRPVMVMIMMMKDQSDQIVDVVMARC